MEEFDSIEKTNNENTKIQEKLNNFYMVLVHKTNIQTPTKHHFSKEEAEKEAERLADKERCDVYVLKTISRFECGPIIKKEIK